MDAKCFLYINYLVGVHFVTSSVAKAPTSMRLPHLVTIHYTAPASLVETLSRFGPVGATGVFAMLIIFQSLLLRIVWAGVVTRVSRRLSPCGLRKRVGVFFLLNSTFIIWPLPPSPRPCPYPLTHPCSCAFFALFFISRPVSPPSSSAIFAMFFCFPSPFPLVFLFFISHCVFLPLLPCPHIS